MPTGIYKRKRKSVSELFENKFFIPYPINDKDCWEWRAKISPFGYGQFATTEGKTWQAHRFSFQLYKGKIPKDMCVCHTCDNRRCVNPKHLWLGNRNDNIQDMIKKGRAYKADSEDNGSAKLNWADVNEIRKLYKTGKFFYKDLAKKFSVCESTIKRINNNWSWKT